MQFLHGFSAIFLSTKALGGSFNIPLEILGLGRWFGVISGTVIAALLCSFFIRYKPDPIKTEKLSPKALAVFLVVFLLLCGFGIQKRVQEIHAYQIDVNRADMLLTIKSQIKDFLNGKSVYTATTFENGRTVARTYLPGLWVAYLPLDALGIDVRYLNIFAHLLFYVLLLNCFLRKGSFPNLNAPYSAGLFLVLISIHVFSKQACHEVRDVQTGPLWIYYCLLAWALMREKYRIALAMSPLVIFSRHPAVLLFLPWAAYSAYHSSKNLKWFIGVNLVAAAVFLVFFIKDPVAIVSGMQVYADFYKSLGPDLMLKSYGPAGVFFLLNAMWLVTVIQVAAVLIALVIAFRATHMTHLQLFSWGTALYTFFLWLTPTAFGYLYAEPLMLTYFLVNNREVSS